MVKHIKFIFLALNLLALALLTQNIVAANLGVWGQVYPIIEDDLLIFIQRRLAELQANGELEKINQQFKKNVREHALRPIPVANLTTTTNPKIFYYDPTFTLKANIADANGKIIIKKGTTVNPLEQIVMHQILLFFDADDSRQMKWAKGFYNNMIKKNNMTVVKFVLVKGNVKETTEELDSRVYFDQHGHITKKLGIKHIPCSVKQEGKKLRIQEYAIDEIEKVGGANEKT